MAEERGDDGGDGVEDELAGRPLDDREGEEDLEAEAPENGAPADGAAVRRGGVGNGEEYKKTEQSGESGEGCPLRRGRDDVVRPSVPGTPVL